MSSFDTNVLSEKVPKFSMAVVEVKRKLEHIVSWATKKSLNEKNLMKHKNFALCKMHKKNQETRTKNENGS